MGGGMGWAAGHGWRHGRRSPAAMGYVPGGKAGAVNYDNAQMPGYAWPSYASYPNYAALTYPKQYSPTAWPYIGPFYPYPQVPLGWRKVSPGMGRRLVVPRLQQILLSMSILHSCDCPIMPALYSVENTIVPICLSPQVRRFRHGHRWQARLVGMCHNPIFVCEEFTTPVPMTFEPPSRGTASRVQTPNRFPRKLSIRIGVPRLLFG